MFGRVLKKAFKPIVQLLKNMRGQAGPEVAFDIMPSVELDLYNALAIYAVFVLFMNGIGFFGDII